MNRTSQEDDLKDDNLTSRQDEGLTERRHHRNLTLQEDDITKR